METVITGTPQEVEEHQGTSTFEALKDAISPEQTGPVPPPPVGITDFVVGDTTYRYDLMLVTAEMAVLADEALQFKAEQMTKQAAKFEDVLASGGVDWLFDCVAALVRKVDGDVPADFNAVSWNAAKKALRSLPYHEMARMREVIRDFFEHIGRGKDASLVLKGKSPRAALALQLVEKLFVTRMQDVNSSTTLSESSRSSQ
jgi:hypothetical protein